EELWRIHGTVNDRVDLMNSARQSLALTINGGLDYFALRNDILSPPDLQFEPNDGQPGTVVLGKASDQRLQLTATLAHTFSPASESFTATTSGGFQYQDVNLNVTSILGRNFLQGQQDVSQAISTTISQRLTPTRGLGLYAEEEFLAM